MAPSNKDAMRKHYTTLTPPERLSAVFAAYGRNDWAEVDALLEKGPRVTLVAPECGRAMQRLLMAAAFHRTDQLTGLALFFLLQGWRDEEELTPILRNGLGVILARQQAFQDFCAARAIAPADLTQHLAGQQVLELARSVFPEGETAEDTDRAYNQWREALEKLATITD